ncbi:MAG: hypothetical protein WA183_19285 [Chthoniobacterales bacterium]
MQLTWQSERTGIEQKWFALTGRVVAAKVEADGDLHLAIGDATGNKPGVVVCEVSGSSSQDSGGNESKRGCRAAKN